MGWGGEEDTVQWDTKATGWEAQDPPFSPATTRTMCEISGKSFHFSGLLLDPSTNDLGMPTLCQAQFQVLRIERRTRQMRSLSLWCFRSDHVPGLLNSLGLLQASG